MASIAAKSSMPSGSSKITDATSLTPLDRSKMRVSARSDVMLDQKSERAHSCSIHTTFSCKSVGALWCAKTFRRYCSFKHGRNLRELNSGPEKDRQTLCQEAIVAHGYGVLAGWQQGVGGAGLFAPSMSYLVIRALFNDWYVRRRVQKVLLQPWR